MFRAPALIIVAGLLQIARLAGDRASCHYIYHMRPKVYSIVQVESLTIPAAYTRLIVDLCEARGVDIQQAARQFDRNVLRDPNGRFKLLDVGALLYQAFLLDEAIGYEIGLNTQLTSHGLVGYGVLTNPTFKDAIDFGIRFGELRTPFITLSVRQENDTGIIEARETFDLGPTRQVCMEHYLIGVWRIGEMLVKTSNFPADIFELYFEHQKPPCHDQYRSRLPACHFSSPANQLRFPSHYLDLPLATADDMAAQLASQECEREKARTGSKSGSLTAALTRFFQDTVAPPSLGEAANYLHMSPRSLKRKLNAERSSYQLLVDQHRERLAKQLLNDPRRSVAGIAQELGYTAPENFTRAFRKWTGMSPTDMRRQYQDK